MYWLSGPGLLAVQQRQNWPAQGSLKGAPLRCSLRGTKFARPGLLVTGEVVDSTYAFTGEGIGKAMEAGMLVA